MIDFKDRKNSDFKKILNETKNEKRLGMHSFHRYYGKLIPAIPRAAIREFTVDGNTIFDPFSGSGTTALEARFLNRNFIGLEINHLAVDISKVKTNNYDISLLEKINIKLEENCRRDKKTVKDADIPFCINRDYWFKSYVQHDLVVIMRNIKKSVLDVTHNNSEKYILFFKMVLSAIIKQVSNADTAHVFPGFSKRMKKLEAEGKNEKDVFGTYFRAVRKRIKYVKEVGNHDVKTKYIICNSSNANLSKYKESIDLIVTNPPYISSVRYSETLKLELYWMQVVSNASEYAKLQTSMIGNDKIGKKEYVKKRYTPYSFINEEIDYMYDIDPKNAKVIFDFFMLMDKVIKNCYHVLKPNKRLIMKISDSRIRKHAIHTGKYLSMIAELNGFKFVEMFNDKINENSRSLTTARNTYSDIILEDNIIIWEKK